MNNAAVFHQVSDSYCYALNENELVINIKTGQDVSDVVLHHNDPFSHGILGSKEEWETIETSFTDKKSLQDHILWTFIIQPEFKRCRYFFRLISEEGTTYYYFSNGVKYLPDGPGNYKHPNYFCFPWMNQSDINITPDWPNQTVWYQIYPDRFCNSMTKNIGDGFKEWDGPKTPVNNHDIYGGDIKGMTSKLDYLKDLGINGIYITPMNRSKSTHKYDTIDYLNVDEQFGSNEDLTQFVKTAHNNGIRVMLDGVFNHCGSEFPYWIDVQKNGPKSPYYDWFMVNQWPFDEVGYNAHKKRFYSFAFSDKMPKFDTNNPQVIQYFIEVCKQWILEYDIDGLRLDVANETSHTFLKELRKQVKLLKPDFYIVGEAWYDSIPWLRGDEFDSVMNYILRNVIMHFWDYTETDRDYFIKEINYCMTTYMIQTNKVMFNLLDSHDTIRTMSRIDNLDRFFQQIVFLFAMPGSPCIYYGTEVALYGKHDPDCRRCMPWKELEDGTYDYVFQIIKNLIHLRRSHNAFGSTEYQFGSSYENKRMIELIKIGIFDKIKIYLNCSDEDIQMQAIESEGFVLFAHKFHKATLKKDGVLILQIS